MRRELTDNRMANVLLLLKKSGEISLNAIAEKLDVSVRSIRNDIKAINEDFQDCAVIEQYRRNYVLRIYQQEIFQQKLHDMIVEDLQNSPRQRNNYIFERLLRANEPLLTDDLAYEMRVGRTTMISELKKFREELRKYGLEIKGKTSKGLALVGSELEIRRYILENNYDILYADYPLDEEIVEILDESMDQKAFDKDLRYSFICYVTLMLDRFLNGHAIGKLSEGYYNLTSKPEYKFVDETMDQVEDYLHTEIPVEERIYAFLPLAGMRTPADLNKLKHVGLDPKIPSLVDKMIEDIQENMHITIDSGDLAEEFLYHVMFMINRLKFGVTIDNPNLEDFKGKYPSAYRMADIAANTIKKEYDIEVSLAEKGFLAFYFEVFLRKPDDEEDQRFRIVVVCSTGRVSSRLISMQLKKIVDSQTEIDLYSEDQVSEDVLDRYDVILTTIELETSCSKPVIRINEIFNEKELKSKLDKVRVYGGKDVKRIDDNWFVLPDILEENHYFYFDKAESYEEAVDTMVDELVDEGQLEEEFLGRLREREERGTMVYDRSLAIPHCIQHQSENIVLAVGVIGELVRHNNEEVQLIFLLGIPQDDQGNEGLLIHLYDEMMSIVSNQELKDKLIGTQSYTEFIRALYRRD